jgi:multiple sugar transport system permease protein
MRRARSLTAVLVVTFGILGAVIVLLPILWGVIVSLKTRADALSMPPRWFFTPTLENYRAAFVAGPYARTLANSLIIAGTSSMLAMIIGVPAAYAFSRSQFRGREAAFLGILAIRMAPATVIALPLFLIFTTFGLIDTYFAIVLVHTAINVALVIWIMKGFIDEVPTQIDEASLLDGDNRFTAMLRQVLPVCAPGLLVTAAFCFINSWNEFSLALMLTGYDSRPFTVAVPALITPHGTYWGQVTAIATVGLLPGVIFALLARRFLVGRLSSGILYR